MAWSEEPLLDGIAGVEIETGYGGVAGASSDVKLDEVERIVGCCEACPQEKHSRPRRCLCTDCQRSRKLEDM
jgi:hypothetical protein